MFDYVEDKAFLSRMRNLCGEITQYLNIKNRYLRQNDHDHPSFICYIEAVNNVYNARMSWK